jgi:hypothetical protein
MGACEAMEIALKGSKFLEMGNLKIGKILRYFPLTKLISPTYSKCHFPIPIFAVYYVITAAFDLNLPPDL